jgi:hypothetical protein
MVGKLGLVSACAPLGFAFLLSSALWAGQPQAKASPSASTFRGYYIFGHGANRFEPCGSGQKYWVVGDQELLLQLRAAYQRLARVPEGPVYVELKGALGPKPSFGAAASHDGVLLVRQIVAVRSKGDGGCAPPPEPHSKK